MTIEQRVEYYRDPWIRQRIGEFLGGALSQDPTCRYLTAGDERSHRLHERRNYRSLDWLLAGGSEIYRSLWDENSMLADFDIEYVNFDHPVEAFLEPGRVFALQEPVVQAIKDLLSEYGLTALHYLTGRGHHFVWRIQCHSDAFVRLASLAQGPESLWAAEAEPHSPEGRRVSPELARAFAGLGLVMEFLAHRVVAMAASRTAIPVELTAIEVGPSEHGREMISIDLSEYGDPLYSRMIRAPFSVYLKPWQQAWSSGRPFPDLPPLLVIPLKEMSDEQGLAHMRDPRAAMRLARSTDTTIPEANAGVNQLIAAYEGSSLAQFHRFYYDEEPDPAEDWPATYDQTPLDILPACARMILEQPNDLLLRPGCIRRLVRVFLALGWHPRHIAGLIYSKYARPFGWTQLQGYDAMARADFYARLFAGLFATGRDDLIDLNCVSAQEQKTCFFLDCGENLLRYRESALHRRKYGKLAHRPFHRLLLPKEHS